jgi:DsbC/DsbD-like thiol-disulfide interchange protein
MRTGVLAVLIVGAGAVSATAQLIPPGIQLGAANPRSSEQRLTTDHLDVLSGVTEEAVVPGSPFSITLDVRPRQGVHVYAPGATGYKVIAFNLERNPLLLSRPTTYPSSEIYFFEPLNERVPVFQKPFRLSRRLTLTTAAEHRATVARLKTLTIRGTLDYQACDDRLCFTPQSLPVSFSVTVKPTDAGRAGPVSR